MFRVAAELYGTPRYGPKDVDAPTTRGRYSTEHRRITDRRVEEDATTSAPPSSDMLEACPGRTWAGPYQSRVSGRRDAAR
jgi:hypothetical protein